MSIGVLYLFYLSNSLKLIIYYYDKGINHRRCVFHKNHKKNHKKYPVVHKKFFILAKISAKILSKMACIAINIHWAILGTRQPTILLHCYQLPILTQFMSHAVALWMPDHARPLKLKAQLVRIGDHWEIAGSRCEWLVVA